MDEVLFFLYQNSKEQVYFPRKQHCGLISNQVKIEYGCKEQVCIH